MARSLRPLFVFGTRPEVIKLAPVIRAWHRRGTSMISVVLATGQHQELMRLAQEELEIGVDRELMPMPRSQSLSFLMARLLEGVDEIIADVEPGCVVAQGDTASVAAAAMAAFFRQIPFVHVEAGLRTGDLRAPWPEEWNRRVVTLATSIHCAPTPQAAENLRSEGIAAHCIHVTGNTIVDALNWTLSQNSANPSRLPSVNRFDRAQRLVLITAHRRENLGSPLTGICRAISNLARDFPDVQFVFPVHLNPNVSNTAKFELSGFSNVHLFPPMRHSEFVDLLARACLIVTDSGGVQEEACTLGKPVLILRETTERPEVLEAPNIRLVGADPVRIRQQVAAALAEDIQSQPPVDNPFGDGRAAERIVDVIVQQCSE